MPQPRAWFASGPGAGLLLEDPVEVADDASALDAGGTWSVVLTFEGRMRAVRWGRAEEAPLPAPEGRWRGPGPGAWTTSLEEADYVAGVSAVRELVRRGEVYQLNLCRVLAAPLTATLTASGAPDPWALAGRLARGNPAPHAAVVDDGSGEVVVSASPELFLARDGDRVASAPVKGTGATAQDLLPKDEAENVMIVDLVRNDLQRVCRPGTVEVVDLLRVEPHPGLVHLVSRVEGDLETGAGWADVLAATAPPGSVSGTPKARALRAITELEPVERGPYCGAVGWVDADRRRASLAVGIRTFWWTASERVLRFGTGAGITWGSEPEREWEETRLKAARLVGLASGSTDDAGHEGSAR